MAVFDKRENKDGSFSYRVYIRKKGNEISKTFKTEEDAKLYAFYRERLIDAMENFDVDISKRVMMINAFELKIKSIPEENQREINDQRTSMQRVHEAFGERFISDITYDEWLEFAKKCLNTYVYKGAKTESSKRLMAPKTILKLFNHASSAISYVISTGVSLENHPVKVIQTFIRPLVKKTSNDKDE